MYEKHVCVACSAAAYGSVDVVWTYTNDTQPLVGRLDAQPDPGYGSSGSPDNVRTSNRRLASTLATEDMSGRTNASRESRSRDDALPRRHSGRMRILTRTAATAKVQNHHFVSRRRLAGTTQRGLRSSRGVMPGRPKHFLRHQQLLGREEKVARGRRH